MSRPEKCLIVGGSGFIGSNLAEHLAAQHVSVRVLARTAYTTPGWAAFHPQIELCAGDVCNTAVVEPALHGVTSVVYLAQTSVPATSMDNPALDVEQNIVPLIRFLQAVSRCSDIRDFVYLSSGGTVYGNTSIAEPIAETHPTMPISGYGLTKLTAEHYVRLCLADTGARPWILRASNVYGPRQKLNRPQGAIGHFFKALVEDQPITLLGTGSVVRDYLYVSDLARAIHSCLTYAAIEPARPTILNVGSGQGVPLIEVLERVQAIVGQSVELVRRAARPFDCQYNVLDTTRIRQTMNWRPMVDFDAGLKETWNWIQGRIDGDRAFEHCRSAA